MASDFLQRLAQYAEDQTAHAVGTDLFAGDRNENAPDNCTVFLDRTPGRENPMFPDHYEYPLQILTRNVDPVAARAEAFEYYNLYFGKQRAGFALPALNSGDSEWYCVCEGNLPGHLGRDAQHRHEYSTNLVLRIHPQPS